MQMRNLFESVVVAVLVLLSFLAACMHYDLGVAFIVVTMLLSGIGIVLVRRQQNKVLAENLLRGACFTSAFVLGFYIRADWSMAAVFAWLIVSNILLYLVLRLMAKKREISASDIRNNPSDQAGTAP
jgi:hypothetical protein